MTATAAPARPQNNDGTRARRWAQMITDGMEPKNIITAVCAIIGSGRFGLPGLGWAAICVVFAAVLPVLFIHRVVKREGGGWAQRHLTEVQLRIVVIPIILLMVTAGLLLLVALHAPKAIIAMQAAMLATLGAVYLITVWWTWKISGHTSVYAGAVAMAAVELGPWWWLALPLVVIIAWARVTLREHTLAQTVAGAALGVTVAGTVFALLN
ncbi:hypothetical protein [Kitasatospora viridis]|uniref:PAP2 superfamily protein n=1 Tax=Kitasatospora viridis TaxID=281105 RepID=A0A561S9X0_9ACTN|nr:hypothetical protein [Kitasatospora viridis]TWF71671.1 hypothetical protein FHX73_1842 [Kitasatospora viridis]